MSSQRASGVTFLALLAEICFRSAAGELLLGRLSLARSVARAGRFLSRPFARVARKPLARMISTRRAKHVAHHYAEIGGRSPILEYTRRQAEALERELRREMDAKVTIAMRYWHPLTAAAISEMAAFAPERLVLLPLCVPPVVLGMGLLPTMHALGLWGTHLSLMLAHGLLGTPLVFLTVQASLKAVPVELEQAARGLGASALTAFIRVTLPLCRPGLLAGAALQLQQAALDADALRFEPRRAQHQLEQPSCLGKIVWKHRGLIAEPFAIDGQGKRSTESLEGERQPGRVQISCATDCAAGGEHADTGPGGRVERLAPAEHPDGDERRATMASGKASSKRATGASSLGFRASPRSW